MRVRDDEAEECSGPKRRMTGWLRLQAEAVRADGPMA